MTTRSLPVFFHLFGWLAFLALPYFFTSSGFARLAEIRYNPHEQRTLASYLLMIGFFYANYYGLIPGLFFRKKFVAYGLAIVAIFALTQTSLVLINRQELPAGQPIRPVQAEAEPGALIQSHVTDKNAHKVAILFYSDPLTWLDSMGNVLLIANGDQRDAVRNGQAAATDLVELQPYLSIASLQTGEGPSSPIR